MAQKSPKIIDVKSPDKVTPTSSGRPLVVTNRPALNADPMVVAEETKEEKPEEVLVRTTKVIAPLDTDLKSPVANDDTKDDAKSDDAAKSEAAAEPTPEASTETAAPTEATPETADAAESEETETDTPPVDPESAAEQAKLEAAKTAREQELEQLIESGKYAAPIDAVHRKRSHLNTVLLCVVAVVLAILLFDAVLDAGLVKLPSSVPHTHFFKS